MTPPLTQAERERWLGEARIAAVDLQKQTESLRHGMSQFPPDFDKKSWREAFDAPVPQRNKCDTALLAFVLGVGEFNTMIQNGTVLDGLMDPALRKMQAPQHYKALEGAGVLKPAERKTLTTINRTRNGIAHIYGEATADEAHEAIAKFEELLGGALPGRLKDWLLPLGL